MKSSDGPLAPVDWAKALCKFKEATGLRQKEIAQALGVRESTISRWFNGTDVPEGEKAARLREYLEKNVHRTEKALIIEVAQTDRLMVLMDSKSNMVSMSKGLMEVFVKLGIETWKTDYTEDGLLRVIEVKLRDATTKALLLSPLVFNYFDFPPI